jgi:hypothetical protein
MSENQKILAISGKKKSGKGTVCNFIHSLALPFFRCTSNARIHEETGDLIVVDADGQEGVLDLHRRDPEFVEYMSQQVYPFIRRFGFADTFKEFMVDVIGLTEEQVYGTDEQKDSLTHLKWEDMPIPHPRDKDGKRIIGKASLKLEKSGFMTAREFMQYFGTEIGREIYGDIWAEGALRRVEKSLTGLAILDDLRFPNEVDATQKKGGKVIRLTRDITKDDHDSEHALDPDKFDWSKFDKVIDNQNLTLDQTCEQVFNTLVEWGWVGSGD